jgi:murein DD-endopeptidase MepM/ murein hydrolase activator NlpD
MNKKIFTLITLIGFLLLQPGITVHAQTDPEYPYYVIQSGDTLTVLAERFGVSTADLISLNNLANPDSLSAGDRLMIPGFEDVTGELLFHTVNLGETYQTLTQQYGYPADLLSRLNRFLSEDEVFIGLRLIMPVDENQIPMQFLATQAQGQTLLETASIFQKNPWEIVLNNAEQLSSAYLPGDTFFQAGQDEETAALITVPGVESLNILPLPFTQGKTVEIKVKTEAPMELYGSIGDREIPFFAVGENEYVGFYGIAAQADTGIVSVTLTGERENEEVFSLNQRVLVYSGYYGEDPAINVDPTTIDPEVTEPEEKLVRQITAVNTPERYWSGMFQYPVDEPCLTAGYGGSRGYNGTFHYYHTGIDFGVCTASNANIYAAAPGKVVFAGPLVVRGNAVIIDHGWGVYTGYWHQAELRVQEGEFVEAGQQLGIIGTTGRSTGYHLHFEVWVNGVQVDPTEWLSNEYP